MGEFLGLAASIGMAALVGALVCLFFLEMGWLRKETLAMLRNSAVVVLSMGSGYFLICALIFQVNYRSLSSVAQIGQIFRGPYLQRVFGALFTPDWFAPVSGLFVRMAHALGSILFGQYMLAGILLAWCMTWVSLCFLQAAGQCVWDEKMAKDLSFLLVCFPGAVFLFLPGCAPVLLLALSLLLFLFRKRFKKREVRLPAPLYGWVTALLTLLSAAVAAASVFGTLG